MKKLCISVLVLLLAATSTAILAQVPDCAVRVDRVATCVEGDPQTDFGYEKEDEMVLGTCDAECNSDVKFRYRINNGGTMELFNCTLTDSNGLVNGRCVAGE